MEKITDKDILARLEKHPFLKKYVNNYIDTEGGRENGEYLPDLVVWFRFMFRALGIEDIPEVLGWDEEMTEEFWSWGHNSRWNHVFDCWLEADVEDSVKVAFEIMDEYGQSGFDCDVETEVKKEIEADKCHTKANES